MTLMSRWLPLNGTVVACAEPKWVESEVVKSVCDLWTLLAIIDIGNVCEWISGMEMHLPSLIGIQKMALRFCSGRGGSEHQIWGAPLPPPPTHPPFCINPFCINPEAYYSL